MRRGFRYSTVGVKASLDAGDLFARACSWVQSSLSTSEETEIAGWLPFTSRSWRCANGRAPYASLHPQECSDIVQVALARLILTSRSKAPNSLKAIRCETGQRSNRCLAPSHAVDLLIGAAHSFLILISSPCLLPCTTV